MDQERNKTKILVVSDTSFSGSIGGLEVSSAYQMNTLAGESGYEVFLFHAKNKNLSFKDILVPDPKINILELPSYIVPLSQGMYRNIFPNPWRLSKEIAKIKPDIIHFHFPSFSSWCCLLYARRNSIPVVYTAHTSSIFLTSFFPYIGIIIRPFFLWYLKAFMKRADHVIYVSEQNRKEFVDNGGLKNPNTVVSNGFMNFESERLNKQDDMLVCTTVSRISKEKNISLLLWAIAYLKKEDKNIRLYIIGDGPDRLILEGLAKSLGIDDRVVFTGVLFGKNLASYYRGSDIFISASDMETEGMSIIEAVGYECPIIISDSSYNAGKKFLNGNGLLFAHEDHKDLAQKIATLMDNPELRAKYSNRSREIGQSLSFRQSFAKLLVIYQSLLR